MDYKELIEQLKNLEAIAYGYNINGEVLGMDCSDFEQIMVDAADSITDLLARAEAAETRVHELETTHRTEICEDGYDCVELGKVRRKLEAAEDRAEKAQTQLREAKHCVAGLSILIKAVDGKMVMETVLPMARSRLEQYKQKYPSGKVVLDTQKEE